MLLARDEHDLSRLRRVRLSTARHPRRPRHPSGSVLAFAALRCARARVSRSRCMSMVFSRGGDCAGVGGDDSILRPEGPSPTW